MTRKDQESSSNHHTQLSEILSDVYENVKGEISERRRRVSSRWYRQTFSLNFNYKDSDVKKQTGQFSIFNFQSSSLIYIIRKGSFK